VIHVSKHFKKKADQDTTDKFIQEQFDVIERFLLEEKDPRTLAAERFYDEVPSGIVKVHKTTRAGATVALCSESVRRKGYALWFAAPTATSPRQLRMR